MQQLNEKIIKINSKPVEQAVLSRLLYGKTIYFTNSYEANWLARRHCNLTVMKLSADFLGLNLIDSGRSEANLDAISSLADLFTRPTGRHRLMDYRSGDYPGDNRQDNYKLMNERYEFESSNFVQHFGLTFRMQSPYYASFARKISALKESSLIANLLAKWSRSSACDANRDRNLYSNSNGPDLHKPYGHIDDYDEVLMPDARDEARVDAHGSMDGSLLADFARLNMAKFKKTENSSINNVRTNHFRANSRSTDRQSYYVSERKSGSLTVWLARLLKPIVGRSTSSEHPWLKRICYLLALSLSLTCLIVLVELLVGARRRKQSDEEENVRLEGSKELDDCESGGNLANASSRVVDGNSDGTDRTQDKRQTNRKQSSKNGRQHPSARSAARSSTKSCARSSSRPSSRPSARSSARSSEPLEQQAEIEPVDDLVAVCELSDLAEGNCAGANYNESLVTDYYRTDGHAMGAYGLCSTDEPTMANYTVEQTTGYTTDYAPDYTTDYAADYTADNYQDNAHHFSNQQFHDDPYTSSSNHAEQHGSFVA